MFDDSLPYLFIVIGVGVVIYLLNRWYRQDFIPDFKSKHVFITGTDSGFGQRLANALDKLGVNVYAGCYTETGAEQLRHATSQRLKTIIIDITDQKSVDRAKEFIQNDLPAGTHLWGLVNNAGITGNLCFQLSELEDYRKVMEVNFFGHVRVCDAFVPLVKKAKGRIVNVISTVGRVSFVAAPYTCSKFALEPYSDGLRRSLNRFGVHVAIIEPGTFNMTKFMGPHIWTELEQKWEILAESEKRELGENYMENLKETFDSVMSLWSGVGLNKEHVIIDALVNALGARHPKSRYVVGIEARPIVVLGTILPDWLADIVVNISTWTTLRLAKMKSN